MIQSDKNLNNEVIKKNNKYYYLDKAYTRKQWYYTLSNFSKFNSEEISLKNKIPNLSIKYVYNMYLDNISKNTFIGLILPSIVFLVVSLVTISAVLLSDYKRNLEFISKSDNLKIILIFISCFLMVLSLGLIYKVVIKKDKCIYTRVKSHQGYKILSYQKYKNNVKIFEDYLNNQFIYFKKIESQGLIIREFKENDYLDYFEFASNANVCKYLSSSILTNISEAKEVINKVINEYKNNQIFKLAIEIKDTSKVIGYIGLSKYDLSLYSCQIVYAINEEYWGNGYVSEAVEAFVEYLKSIGKTLIIAGHVKDNIASGKVLLKNGFVRDPSRDTKMIIHNELKEIVNYSIDERNKK